MHTIALFCIDMLRVSAQTGALMPIKEFVTVRIPKDIFEKAKTAAHDLGDPGAAWVIVRSVIEMLELAEIDHGDRRVPKLVRTLDAARSDGPLLPEGEPRRGTAEPERSHAGHRKLVVKGARG